jgi:hypothetical protein
MKDPVCFELKLALALEAVSERDLITDEHRNLYGEGFLAGFDKAMDLEESKQNKGMIKDETSTKSPKIIIRRNRNASSS